MSYQDVKDKLYHGHRKIANNTYLRLLSEEIIDGVEFPEYIVMSLHSHTVARFYPDYLQLFSAGWHTHTIKDKLNLALELVKVPSYCTIYQSSWQWYYESFDDSKPFYDGMKIDYTGRVIN